MTADEAVLEVEWIRAEGVRLRTADGSPFDVARSSVRGEVQRGDLVRLRPEGVALLVVPAPEAVRASTFADVMGRLRRG